MGNLSAGCCCQKNKVSYTEIRLNEGIVTKNNFSDSEKDQDFSYQDQKLLDEALTDLQNNTDIWSYTQNNVTKCSNEEFQDIETVKQNFFQHSDGQIDEQQQSITRQELLIQTIPSKIDENLNTVIIKLPNGKDFVVKRRVYFLCSFSTPEQWTHISPNPREEATIDEVFRLYLDFKQDKRDITDFEFFIYKDFEGRNIKKYLDSSSKFPHWVNLFYREKQIVPKNKQENYYNQFLDAF